MAAELQLVQGAAPATPAAGITSVFSDSARDRYFSTLDDKGILSRIGDHELSNLVRNSGFWFAQRQAPGTLTSYTSVGGRVLAADGWSTSNENSSIQYRRVDTSGAKESGLQGRYWGEFTKITATGKFAVMQVIEGSDAQALRGQSVRVQAWVKAIIGTPVSVKIGLLCWTGTLDTVPAGASGIFTAWGANGVDPTLAATLAWMAPKAGVTPDNAAASTNSVLGSATTTWQRFGGVFDIPDTCRNLIVVIWTDNQVIATNGIGVSQVSLTAGMEIQDWAPLDVPAELDRVRRFYQKSFALDTGPIQNNGLNSGERRAIAGKAGAVANAGIIPIVFQPEMAKSPAVTVYNPAAANALGRNITGAADLGATAITGTNQCGTYTNSTGVAATAVGDVIAIHFTADAEL